MLGPMDPDGLKASKVASINQRKVAFTAAKTPKDGAAGQAINPSRRVTFPFRDLKMTTNLGAQIHHMHISSEAHIVGKIPSDMVRIRVDDDLIRVPEPVRAECQIGVSN